LNPILISFTDYTVHIIISPEKIKYRSFANNLFILTIFGYPSIFLTIIKVTLCMKASILFLGASKRVSLLERFLAAAAVRKLSLQLFSCEIANDFYPISQYATILQGPRFTDQSFHVWLTSTVSQYDIDIVIPNTDSATVALSRYVHDNHGLTVLKPWCVVSDFGLCMACEDKILARQFFQQYELPIIDNTPDVFPKILKLRTGFGSKNIYHVTNAHEMQMRLAMLTHPDDYVIEDFIFGQETTTDMYFTRQGEPLGYVLRDRLEVSDGEVMVCVTRSPEADEKKLLKQVADIPGWVGCINIQSIREENGACSILEINPRFGGGSTAAIQAGLDMAGYVLDEYTQKSINKHPLIQHIKMTRARRDFFTPIVS
jgi:carbamoyl-phosphate synthase large subunit